MMTQKKSKKVKKEKRKKRKQKDEGDPNCAKVIIVSGCYKYLWSLVGCFSNFM